MTVSPTAKHLLRDVALVQPASRMGRIVAAGRAGMRSRWEQRVPRDGSSSSGFGCRELDQEIRLVDDDRRPRELEHLAVLDLLHLAVGETVIWLTSLPIYIETPTEGRGGAAE